MNRAELIERLVNKIHQHEVKMVDKAVKSTLKLIIETLKVSERVEIRDFGVFTTKKMEAKLARNPRNGVIVSVPAKRKVHFKPGKILRAKVNHEGN